MKQPILVGEKVYFRPLSEEDIENGWLDWINDPECTLGLTGVRPVTKTDLLAYFKSSNENNNTVMFAICDKETDEYIGNCRLASIDWINRNCTYGRLIGNKKYWGNGIGTEVLKLMFYYGFCYLNLERIYSGAVSNNQRSIKNNEKFGMTVEGTGRKTHYSDGQWFDTIFLSMLREEYLEKYGVEFIKN